MDNKGPKVVGASAKNNMTPGFLGGSGGGETPAGLNTRNEKGASLLGAAESAAVNADIEQSEDNLDGAREDEENVNYTGSGREEDSSSEGGFLSGHKGPIATIVGLFLLIAGIMGGSQMMQPFSLVEQIRTTFNTMQTSVATRSNSLVKYQIDNGLMKSPTKPKLFGGEKFSLTKKQKTKLAKQGIDYDQNLKAMVYTDSDGKKKYIVADTKDIDSVKSKVDSDNVITVREAFDTDTNFLKAYQAGSMTWRGAIANWFESATMKFLNDNRITRNLFDGFKQKVEENGGNVRATVMETMAKGTDEIIDGGSKFYGKEVEKDDKGNLKSAKTVDANEPSKTTIKTEDFKSEANIKSNIENKVKANVDADAGGGISGTVQTITSGVCAISDTIGAITLLVSASEAIQTIRLVTAYMEAIDKVKAGSGDDSPINDLMSALNETKTNEHYDLDIGQPTSVESVALVNTGAKTTNETDVVSSLNAMTANANNIKVANATTTTKSAMSSSGVTALYSGGKVDPDDPSVKSFNFSGSIKRIVGGLGVSMAAFTTCSIAKIVANGAGAVEGLVNVGTCVLGAIAAPFTFGGSVTACGGMIYQVISGIALSAAVAGIITAVISAVVPFAAKLLTRDLISNLGGEDLGNALVSGGNMYLGNAHRYNGGSLASKNKYTEFALAQQQVIAEQAEYERSTRSPFDIASPYTFMGSIANSFMNFSGSSSIMNSVDSAGDVLSSSIAKLSPTASAIDVNNSLIDNYEEVCPYLASIGAVGDAYCNPYSITDMSTINDDPSEVVEKVKDNLQIVYEDGTTYGCTGDECPTDETGIRIKANSDLAKYIEFCDMRSSGFGVADTNIANSLADFGNIPVNGTIGGIINGGVGAIPAVGDVIDVVQNGEKLANYGYIFGHSCVAGNTADQADAQAGENNNPSWENKAKYYQRFIEDQSLFETMGIIEKSAVTAYLEENDIMAPVDNSYEALLAKYSGMTKEKVVSTLDFINDALMLENYDPSTRYAFGNEAKPEEELRFDGDQKEVYTVLLNTIEFADVRNRNFVV